MPSLMLIAWLAYQLLGYCIFSELAWWFQVWLHLSSTSNNMLALPPIARSSKQRLQLTRSGSTGDVWEARFDTVTICLPSRLSRCYARLMRNADNDFVPSSTFTSPSKRNLNLSIYAIVSLRAAMGRLRMIAWIFSSLIYVMTFWIAGKSSVAREW